MSLDFWKSLSGMLRLSFTGAAPEETLDTILENRISVSKVKQKTELTYEILIQRKDYKKVTGILQRKGNEWRILRKQGLYWHLTDFLRRPVLLSAFLLLLLSSYYLPSRIFFIAVEGNKEIPDRLILSAAEDCGIRFAASRKQVRSEKVKNALLSAVPQLQWAGVNTYGCRAVISVRERTEETSREDNYVSSLIADRDGYILSATVTRGTANCVPGETVVKGQLLISGYTDCDFCIRATRAEGEILAQTGRKLACVMPKTCGVAKRTDKEYCKFSLLVGKKRINFWKDSRISHAGCGRMYEEYYISLPGGFPLPVAFCVERYQPYDLENAEISHVDAQDQLQRFSDGYLDRQMVAGQILQKQQLFSDEGDLYRLESSYICSEIIGKERREQIGDINGKRN